ncbi:MAG: hypothetical protein ACE37D_01710 [Pseudomonadales bacterium]
MTEHEPPTNTGDEEESSRFSERRSQTRDRRINQSDRRATERVGLGQDRRQRPTEQSDNGEAGD